MREVRKKLKPWQKTVISYVSFLLVLAIAAGCFVKLAISPDDLYGIESGIIEHSNAGENITDRVLKSEENTAVLENEFLALSLTNDGNIVVKNKQTETEWSTAVAAENESKFEQGYNQTHSLLSVTYVNDKNAEAEWTSYEQSVKKNQMQIYKLSNNTVRLDFILGESSSDQLVPTGITKERFEEDILPKLDEDDQEFMKRQYLLYEADKLTAADDPATLYELYPKLKSTPIYIAGNINSKITKQKLTRVFEEIGYTAADYDHDNELTGYGASSVTFTYKVVMDLSLEGNDLVVKVPKNEIVFYTKHPLLRISLLKFLTNSTEKASVLIPSGSGAIAEFSPNQSVITYRDKVYGEDLTVNSKTLPSVMDTDSKLAFPMFSVRKGGDTVTAIIDSAAASAALNYNTTKEGMFCYYDFTVLQSDKAYIDEKNNVIQCGSDVLAEDISMRYRFSSADSEASDYSVYSKVACDYRALLEQNGILPENTEKVSDDPVLLLDILGSVTVKKDMLGLFPVNTDLVMTDFDKATEMVNWFDENSASQLKVKLSGWNKGGLYRQSPGKISFLQALGGKKGYESFAGALKEKNITAYYSAEHITFLNPSAFDGYSKNDTAMFVDGSEAVLGIYSAVEGANFAEGSINIISPSRYEEIAKAYAEDFDGALSVGGLGNSLNSDYSANYFDRTRAEAQVIKALKHYKEKGVGISVEDINAYAAGYCEMVENISVTAGDNTAFSQSFPLKQFLLHGVVDYTAQVDFSITESKETVLNSIRAGSGLKAVLSYENFDYSFPDYYSYLYSTDYSLNRDKIAEYSNMTYEALKGLGTEKIVSFETLGNVSKTVYSNGTEIYVNTGSVDAEFDTLKVGAMSYLRIDK